jgi:hypothetical protein
MIIFIPTNKRTETLPFALKSILNSHHSIISERILILVRNNYLPDKEKIDEIISSLKFDNKIYCKVVHAQKESVSFFEWYDVIFEFARENEGVMILGDDDLLMPFGIENRYKEINRLQGDLLITLHSSRLVFFNQGNYCWPNFTKKKWKKNLQCENKFYLKNLMDASFISNHFFRNTDGFHKGLKLVKKWCDNQTWAPIATVTALICFYLIYAIKEKGGKVLFLPEHSVIRGQVFQESLYQAHSDNRSNFMFSLLALNIFSNKNIHKNPELFNREKKFLLNALRKDLYELLYIKDPEYSQIKFGMKSTNINWTKIIISKELFNLKSFLRFTFPFLKGNTYKKILKNRKELVESNKYLDQLKDENKHNY